MESSIAEFLKRKSACELLPTITVNQRSEMMGTNQPRNLKTFRSILPLLFDDFFHDRLENQSFQKRATPVSTGFPSGIIR